MRAAIMPPLWHALATRRLPHRSIKRFFASAPIIRERSPVLRSFRLVKSSDPKDPRRCVLLHNRASLSYIEHPMEEVVDPTTESGGGFEPVTVRQFTVFLENRVGRLTLLVRALEESIRIMGLSI